jgi:transposase
MAGTSCEPGRRKAYSEDVRWRIIWQKEVMGLTVREVASNLGVGVGTVWRMKELFYNTGSIQKRTYPVNRHPEKKLTDPVKILILQTVAERPQVYLREIQNIVQCYTGFDVSPSLLCGYLKDMNFSRQRMKIVAKQRDEELRCIYRSDVSLYERHMLVFVDETGADRRDSLRKYGYSVRGKTPKSFKMLVRGKRISTIAIMTVNGILDMHIVHGTSKGDDFLEFVEKCLLPCLMPFNGVNANSIVILDNCSIHHVASVTRLISEVGALVHYLPPYSPDYNPIEWCFSKAKKVISTLEQEMEAIGDIELIVRSAFETVTPNNCENWIKDCEIYQ